MLSLNCDIEKFNLHVRVQRDALMSRSETSSDLLTKLFTAYEAVEDKVFHDYMVGQQDQYHDGRVDFCVDSLMDLALNKFKMLVESKQEVEFALCPGCQVGGPNCRPHGQIRVFQGKQITQGG
jgi:hypothetical protein